MNVWLRLIPLLLLLAGAATAAPPDARMDNGLIAGRGEVWLAVTTWSDLVNLTPAAGGNFDDTGYGIGGAYHWPVRRLGSGRLLLGLEAAVMATDSDVPVYLDDLLARDAYLAVSGKWLLGRSGSLALDAGLAMHLLDITQLDSNYRYYLEFESWEETAIGAILGVTWDVGVGQPGSDSGMTLGLRAHFVDFGTVRDEDVFITPILGPNAGDLGGPLYELRIGYRWR